MSMLSRHIIFFLFLTGSIVAYGQSAAETQADKHFADFNFEKAAELYEKAFKRDPGNYLLQERIGDCYRLMNDPQKALEWYQPLVEMPNADADLFFNFAQASRSIGEYEQAAVYYDKFAEEAPQDSRANLFDDFLGHSMVLAQPNPNIEVFALGELNTDDMEFGPAILGDNLIFTSNREVAGPVGRKDNRSQGGFLRMYLSYESGKGDYSSPELLTHDKPSPKLHEGPATFTGDGVFMYFSKSRESGGVKRGSDGALHLDIYEARLYESQGRWVDLKPLAINSKDYSSTHPSVSPDGQTLFFVSNKEEGYGGTDIYVSYKKGNAWGAPVNLGSGINTPGNEMYPYIANDGTLYFTSDSRVGLGGLDLYSAQFKDGVWANVKNLGAPINSEKDDFSYCLKEDGKIGFFASNRYGNDDLFRFEINKIAGPQIDLVVMDRSGKQFISGAQVKLLEQGASTAAALISTDNSGLAKLKAQPLKNYKVIVTKEGYPSTERQVRLSTDNSHQTMVVKMGTSGSENIVQGDYTVEVQVKDRSGDLMIKGAEVRVINLNSGEGFIGTTNEKGVCFFPLSPNSDYEITASYEDPNSGAAFFSSGELMTTIGKKPPAYIYTHLTMEKLQEGAVVTLQGIDYPYDKAIITDSAIRVLNKVIKTLEQYPNMEIELRSHTGCTGEASYNLELSQRRADAAAEYIFSQGIERSRVTANGYGEREPKVVCEPCSACSEMAQKQNSRTELKVIKVD